MAAVLHRASQLLASPRIIAIAAGLAVVLTLSSLGVGLTMDDYFHQLILSRGDLLAEPRSPLDLFRFMSGNPAEAHRLMDIGVVPWWTWPAVRGAFWRPLTSATHWLDHQLWPDWPSLMHLQSVAWYALLVAGAAVLYRRIIGPVWVAGLAALLYAIDDAHGLPVGWLANRNAVITAAFGVAAILAHERWRSRGPVWAGLLATMLLAASLLSGEAGIAACAYLFAYAVFIEQGDWRRRLLSLVPYVAVVVVWRVLWTAQGYGVHGLGLYTDPLGQPVQFLHGLVSKIPVLLLGQFAAPPAETLFLVGERGAAILWWIAVVVGAGLAGLLAPVIRASRPARFFACGMLLSLLPISATFPSDRLLLFVGIGAMGLLALFFDWLLGRWQSGAVSKRVGILMVPAFVLVVFHLAIAPIALPIRAAMPIGPPKMVEAMQVRGPLDARIAEQSLVVVNAPSAMLVHYLPIVQSVRQEPRPRHTRVLAPAVPAVAIERRDERTLVVEPEAGFYSMLLDQLFRTPEHAFQVADRVELSDMTVEIAALTPDRRPAKAIFTFDVPLEDASLRWLAYADGRFVPFAPPPPGQQVVLRADWPW